MDFGDSFWIRFLKKKEASHSWVPTCGVALVVQASQCHPWRTFSRVTHTLGRWEWGTVSDGLKVFQAGSTSGVFEQTPFIPRGEGLGEEGLAEALNGSLVSAGDARPVHPGQWLKA